jgi:AefR-like transcriptional repressor, C-terminal domain
LTAPSGIPEVAATFYEVAIQPTAQMMTDWLCRQGEHGKIELEDTQTAVEMLRGFVGPSLAHSGAAPNNQGEFDGTQYFAASFRSDQLDEKP